VVVQVGAFRHALEKLAKLKRTSPNAIELLCCPLFGRGVGGADDGRRRNEQQDGE
jgi:hypothetical protein